MNEIKEFKTESVNVKDVKIGDTVICDDGIVRTVTKGKLKYDSFTGWSLFGSTYALQKRKIKKIIYPIWRNGEIINY